MSATEYRVPLRIAPDHPSLPGHFPGHPVVPGVVLLDRVAAALEAWRGVRMATLPQVKFLAPLKPEETAELVLETRREGRYAFRITRDGALVASGEVEAA